MTYIEIFKSLLPLIIPICIALFMWQELSAPTPFSVKKQLMAIQFDLLRLRYKLYNYINK